MKKLLALLLTLAFALVAIAVPSLADALSANGIQIYPIRSEFNDYGGNNVSLRVYMRVVNNSGHPLTILLNDVQADGVPVYGAGISGLTVNADTGNNSDEYFLFKPEYESDDAAARALRDARTLTMTLQAFDNSTYDDVAVEAFVIDLSSLGNSGPSYGSDSSSYDYSDSSASYAPPYTPKSTNYQTLKQGSKGQAVRDLQQRLTDLGYLNDKVDGSYGRNTTTAVRSFCEQHGLPIGSEATPEMQQLLYSSRAQYYEEPYIPLVIASTYKLENPQQTGVAGVGMLTQLVVNRSSTRAIRGFVLNYYQTDMYGNKIDLGTNGTGAYYVPVEQMNYIEPGHYKDAFVYAVNSFYSTYAVYVGVQKVVFDDGEVREYSPDEITYFECRVQN